MWCIFFSLGDGIGGYTTQSTCQGHVCGRNMLEIMPGSHWLVDEKRGGAEENPLKNRSMMNNDDSLTGAKRREFSEMKEIHH